MERLSDLGAIDDGGKKTPGYVRLVILSIISYLELDILKCIPTRYIRMQFIIYSHVSEFALKYDRLRKRFPHRISNRHHFL